jgi:hypothetical protein
MPYTFVPRVQAFVQYSWTTAALICFFPIQDDNKCWQCVLVVDISAQALADNQ